MSDLTRLPDTAYYIARCLCHEWVLVRIMDVASCGGCGERPEFLSDYDGRSDWGRPR